MYIVVQQENHPDRLIEETFGPFDSYDHAEDFAIKSEAASCNFNHDHRLFRFVIRELINPETVTWL